MPLFDHHEFDGHEEVVFCHDAASGLKAIIAIHNSNLGPALGGCRMWPYASEEEALTDVLRLSKGMTYKAALAGLAFGGGKSVILGDPRRDKSEALFRAGIRPTRAAGRISSERIGRLADAIRSVLDDALAAGGTTLRDFTGSDGQPGYFAQRLDVYDREGLPCPGCDGPVRRKVIGQRSTFYCPTCQR